MSRTFQGLKAHLPGGGGGLCGATEGGGEGGEGGLGVQEGHAGHWPRGGGGEAAPGGAPGLQAKPGVLVGVKIDELNPLVKTICIQCMCISL